MHIAGISVVLRDGSTKIIDLRTAEETILGASYAHWYDALPAGEGNAISLADLSLPAYLSAVPNFKRLLELNGWDNLRNTMSAASGNLERIPTEISLLDWDDTGESRLAMRELFLSCLGTAGGFPYFGPATATKLLHKKRPDLIPIIDSWQLCAWGKPAYTRRVDDLIQVMIELKGQLSESADQLLELKGRLKSCEQPWSNLSLLRLYDILFWEFSNSL